MGKGVFTLDTILRMVHDLKKDGKVIGFTHGVFDLFHIGHLDFLQQSARKCDFLIVGIDSDDKVAKYKGDGRPIIPEDERAKVVAALECVGAVFIKDILKGSRAHISLYRKLSPNFVFIGAGFHFEENVRKEGAKAKVTLIKIGHKGRLGATTTTTTINRIIERYAKETTKGRII